MINDKTRRPTAIYLIGDYERNHLLKLNKIDVKILQTKRESKIAEKKYLKSMDIHKALWNKLWKYKDDQLQKDVPKDA